MSAQEIRTTLVHALYDLNATRDVSPSRLAAFEDGTRDIELGDLNLGSLARMELLVALELEHGAVIDPDVLLRLESLNDIVALVQQTLDVGSVAPAAEPRSVTGCDASAGRDELAPSIVRIFRRAFRGCRAVAQVNKLLKLLEHRLTPSELATLRSWHRSGGLIPAQAPPRFAARLSEWTDQMARLMEGSGKAEPEPFRYERVGPAAVLFVGPGERAKKTLLICFPTLGGRQMWMPNALLLQYTDAREYDVLVLSDLWRTGFRSGVPGMGRDETEVAEWLAHLEWVGGYGRVRTMGCSAGAYPAMLTARRLDAELAVAVCGRFPRLRPRRIEEIVRMHRNCWAAARRSPDVRVVMIHGRRRRDRMFAGRIAWLTGANRLRLKMPGRVVPHNLVSPLIEHGALGYFLGHCVFAPVEDRLLAGSGARATMTIPTDGSAAARELTVRGRGYRRTRIAM